jgi:hypothetical protein
MPVAASASEPSPGGAGSEPHSGSGRMPFTTAFRTESAPTPSPTPAASRLPCPWRPRESETSSGSRLHAAPSALRLLAAPTRGLRPAPIRQHRGFGSGRERPSPCVGSHRSLRPALTLDPRLREARHATPKCQWTGDDDGSGSEEPAPNRNAHGFATRFASHMCSFQRSGASALPPTVTRCDRWLETTHEEACRPCSARRREASCCDVRPDTVQGTHSARPVRRRGRSEELDRPPTGSLPRCPLTAHPVELLEGVTTSSRSALRITRQLTPHPRPRPARAARRPPSPTQSHAKS